MEHTRAAGELPDTATERSPEAAPVKGPWFDVPMGTKVDRCRSGCLQPVYWIRTRRGRPLLVDCDVAGGARPTPVADGKGVAHFATCPKAELWRGRR